MQLIVGSQNVNAQFFKKLKQQAQEKVLKKTDEILSANEDAGKNPQNEPSAENNKGSQPEASKKNNTKKQTNSYTDTAILVYKSPDPAFKDIAVQKFKDLPRFGSCDFYMMPDNPKRPELTPEAGEKRRKMELGYSGFLKLARIHTLKDHFKVMDRTALTPQNRNLVEEEVKSRLAQKTLLEFAFMIGTEELKKEYFLNDWSGTGKSPFVQKWGGHQSDDFTEHEKYVSFVEKYLDKILKWSEDFFSNGTESFYLVQTFKFQGQYDFDKNGFWITLPTNRRNTYGMDYSSTNNNYFFEFSPKTPYGQQVLNKTNQAKYVNGLVLFKVSPEKAEALLNNKTKNLQMVSKVQTVFQGFEEANPTLYSPKYTYHFLDSEIELYEDLQLTKRIGEINLERLTYKEQ
ncbi:hypothetical protein DX873_12845 [Flagellimonas nanhaiensis]|uniref:Uncharacterized protein n=2 Tax=Flagellimonas nanhaiensis TaxID=2292706 RepID=A0A371JRT0_9FLAO|nr:hypothetical protein DX873_12845 [Allomuricauda nanhaiensis]